MPPANLEPVGQAVVRKETCPLCGFSFEGVGQGCRPGCPLGRSCHMVCCPQCFYSFPQDTWLAGALRRLLERRK
jgi:hypothetical protein